MKTKNNIRKALYFLIALVIFSCTKEDKLSEKSVVDATQGNVIKSDFDKFLEREFTKPYNIEVKYKLDDINTNFNYNVTPVSEEKAIKMANLLKYICLEAYEKHSPKNFLKEYFPKSIVFVGSGAYNDDNTVLLGTADGGVEITLYRINDLKTDDTAFLTRWYFNTIFHEFSHILHQNKDYTKDYEKISAADYVGDEWSRFWKRDNPSIKKGFISNYSSKEVNEDFVEIISHYITLSEAQWKALVNPDGENKEGEAIINKKLAIIKAYLKNSWSIDLDALKNEVQERYVNLANQDLDNIK